MQDEFNITKGLLYYQGKLSVTRRNINDILQLAHDSPVSGHFSHAKTLERLHRRYWRQKTKNMEAYFVWCLTCQMSQDGRTKPLGSPEPLEIPNRRRDSISMGFVTHLPKTTRGHDCITTFKDWLTKRIHLVQSRTTNKADDVVKSFFENIFRLHGLPDSIVSDRDPRFTSRFWSQLMELCEVQLKMSTNKHSQTGGSTEIMKRMVANFLRCYVIPHHRDWDNLLTAAEYAYYSSHIDSLGMSPFEADLGRMLKSSLDFHSAQREATVQGVASLKQRLSTNLENAQFSINFEQAR